MSEDKLPEPWLRGTLTDVPPLQRVVLHALQLAHEDVQRWCAGLSDAELNARPSGIEPISFHLRHIARSIDRLLTYAEGLELNAGQMEALKSELHPGGTKTELFGELATAIERAAGRIRAFRIEQMNEPRAVGRRKLPTTVAGLLIHIADHTHSHAGQVVTTAKILVGMKQKRFVKGSARRHFAFRWRR
jgi:uncharacterized damage-inducible protein DinB